MALKAKAKSALDANNTKTKIKEELGPNTNKKLRIELRPKSRVKKK